METSSSCVTILRLDEINLENASPNPSQNGEIFSGGGSDDTFSNKEIKSSDENISVVSIPIEISIEAKEHPDHNEGFSDSISSQIISPVINENGDNGTSDQENYNSAEETEVENHLFEKANLILEKSIEIQDELDQGIYAGENENPITNADNECEMDYSNLNVKIVELNKESTWTIALQTGIPLLISGLGMVVSGILLAVYNV